MSKHCFVLHLHNLGVILFLDNHNALFLQLVGQSCDLHAALLARKLVLAALHEELIHLVLQHHFLVRTLMPHLDYIVL